MMDDAEFDEVVAETLECLCGVYTELAAHQNYETCEERRALVQELLSPLRKQGGLIVKAWCGQGRDRGRPDLELAAGDGDAAHRSGRPRRARADSRSADRRTNTPPRPPG